MIKTETIIRQETILLQNWFRSNRFLGVNRKQLENFMFCKNYIKKTVISKLRKEKRIFLDKKRYFYKSNE